jgi:hypothetical protein
MTQKIYSQAANRIIDPNNGRVMAEKNELLTPKKVDWINRTEGLDSFFSFDTEYVLTDTWVSFSPAEYINPGAIEIMTENEQFYNPNHTARQLALTLLEAGWQAETYTSIGGMPVYRLYTSPSVES